MKHWFLAILAHSLTLATSTKVVVIIRQECNSFLPSPNGENCPTDTTRWTVLRSVFSRPDSKPVSHLVSHLRSPTKSLYAELRKCLKDPDWARDFLKENGFETLLETFRSLQGRNFEELQLKGECGHCLRLAMDSRVGLDYIMENADYTQKLAAALDTDDIPVKKQVFELLSAVCVYRPEGYTRALETLEHYKNSKKHRYRFQLVVDEMRCSTVAEYTTALVAFVNCVIISPASLNDRIRIRNEFLGLKILELLDKFRKQCKEGSNSDLAVQLDVFDEQRSTDEGQFSGPDGVDLSSHMDVFFAILRQVAETPQEMPFLSILQHLLRTDLNQPLSEIVWESAETLVHRATLLESRQEADRLLRASNLGGLMRCHCSCHYRQTTTEDCETTPGKKNRPNQLSFCSPDGTRTPSLILSPNQQQPPPTPYDVVSSPGPFSNASDVVARPHCKGTFQKQTSISFSHITSEQSSTEIQAVSCKDRAATIRGYNPVQISQTASSASSETKRISTVQCDKHVTSNNVMPDSDTFNHRKCDSAEIFKRDQIVSDSCSRNGLVEGSLNHNSNVPPPPPPPPPMTGGGPPPPPPPPPPPTSLRVPIEAKKSPVITTLPQQDTPKPKAKMKSFNWSKIPTSKVIGKDNLWSRVAKDHTGSPNDLDFDAMERLFCQQALTNGHVSPKFGDSTEGVDKRKKEIQEINLLDGKRSLNINIFLKQFRSTHESIARILEDGAHEDLGAERLRGLLKILPETDEVDLLKNFDGDKIKLGNAERFLLKLIEVPSYKLRIESMLLKEEFMVNQEFLENSIETIRCAAQELEECRKLHEILYMVLVAGNFLNAGGYAGNAAGFKMLSLLKLTDIRANKPSMTLIHYVAEQVFKKRPDLLAFLEEIQNLEEASKISMETLKADVSSLCQRVTKVSTQVSDSEEQIRSQMQDFLEFAESKVETIQNEINNMESIRQRLGDFLCEDTSAFKLEDCFKVFQNFCSRFKSALQENEKRQKQEKLAEARRKQREQQIALKRRSLELSDYRSGVDADHIMDQLLGDIRSGFPERRLGDVFRRSRRSYDPDDNLGSNGKDKSALKRHSDPAMLEKCTSSQYQDDKNSTFKSRRARFLEETNGEEIIDYLQNPILPDTEIKDRRTFGNADDNLERSSFRRSGRRKRIEHLNGETTCRERSCSSPPPPILTVVTDPVVEDNTKQKLKSKINEWMLQNEREQKRDRVLQAKLLEERKKRQMNGYISMNGDIPKSENGILEEIKEIDVKQGYRDNLQITKSAQSRQSESFTQKIIGLLDSASSHESMQFAKTRLYHSTREKKSTKEGVEEKSKDDSQISNSNDVQKPVQNYLPYQRSSLSNSDESSKEIEEKSPDVECNFDRFAVTRKTQRRLKLREMRLEAENAIKIVKNSATSTGASVPLSPSNPTTDESSLSVASEINSPQTEDECFGVISVNKNEQFNTEVPIRTFVNGSSSEKIATQNSSLPSHQGASEFNRQRNTSLRSRQSRLARRINSLSTSVTSPELNETNSPIPELKNSVSEEAQQNGSETPVINLPSNSGKTNEKEPLCQYYKGGKQQLSDTKKSEKSSIDLPKKTILEDSTKTNGVEKALKENPPKTTQQSIPKVNGRISQKVTVSTETKSKVILPKSNLMNRQVSRASTSSSKSQTTAQKTTSIPSVIKTTQNVKVQQTIHRQSQTNGKTVFQKAEVNSKRNAPSQFKSSVPNSSCPSASPTMAKKVQSAYNEQKSSNLKNGKTESFKNGKGSPSSSISLSTNVKLINNEKVSNGKPYNPVNTKKITINHNGSVRFTKESSASTKASQRENVLNNSNSNTSKSEKNNATLRKRAFI